MKKIFIFALCVALLTACSGEGYEIAGTVDKTELNGKYVYLYEYGPQVEIPTDSALVENGTFFMKGTAHTPKLFVLEFNADDLTPQRGVAGANYPYTAVFVLENAKLKINLTEKPIVMGTPENDAWTILQKELTDFKNSMDLLREDMNSDDDDVSAAAEKMYDDLYAQSAEAVRRYIIQYPDKQSSAKLLYDFRHSLDEDFRREAISKAGPAFLAVPNIDKLVEHLAVLDKVSVGKKFSDIVMPDPEGVQIKLSDYAGKGKVVLIDFWASWCPPCRADMPHLVKLYDQYKDKGFEIVGVSLDRNVEDWKKGIKDLHITWPQMSDVKFWQSEGAALYGVNSIPHTVLLDKDGTIIAKNLRGAELDRKLAEFF